MNTLDKINIQLEELEKKRQESLEEISKDFPLLFTELFEQSKLINSLSWTQYTPYFMDGDECIFGVNLDYVYINGEYNDDVDWFDDVEYTSLDTEEKVSAFNNFIESPEGARYKYLGVRKLGQYGYLPNPKYDEKESKLVEEFTKRIEIIPDEFLRSLFGDHVKVTLHKDGSISTDHYSHD